MVQYNNLTLSGSLEVKDGITGSLFGTASYALNGGGGGASIIVSGAAPTQDLSTGSLWFNNTTNNSLYVYTPGNPSGSWLNSIDTGSFITTSVTKSIQEIDSDILLKGKIDFRYGDENIVIGMNTGGNLPQDETLWPATSNVKSNVLIGNSVGGTLETGSSNILIGDNVLNQAASAGGTIAIGSSAMSNAKPGNGGNIAIGGETFENLVPGVMGESHNIAIGNQAGRTLTSGSNTIALGHGAAYGTVSGETPDTTDSGIFIGHVAQQSGSDSSFEIVIGPQAKGQGSFTTMLGSNNFTTTTYIAGMVTASLFSGSFIGYLSGSATSASYASDSQLLSGSDYATLITTGSIGGEQGITGSLQIAGNLSVLGSASFQYVTSSQVLLNNNTITVQALGLSAPSGGLIVIDSGSEYSSSAFFYNIVTEEWTLDKPLNATASYARNVIGYAETFTTASLQWNVSHSLGIDFPTVTCWDTSTRKVILPDEIESLDRNNVKIYFTAALTGSVRIS